MKERRIGIRELNQNSGQVIRSLATKGPVVVTDHGRPVAVITEYTGSGTSGWDRLVHGEMVQRATTREPVTAKRRKLPVGWTTEQLLADTRGEH